MKQRRRRRVSRPGSSGSRAKWAACIRMVDEDRYCIDVLTQINAVRAALHKVEEQILRDHVSHCVADAFASGDAVEQRHKVEELVATIGRMTR